MRKEQLEKALEVAIQGLRELGLDYAHHTARVEAKVDSILHPAPAYEEVPYERWECKTCGTVYKSQAVDKACCCGVNTLIYLSGVDRRPLPRPVERSVEVEAEIDELGDVFSPDNEDYAFKNHPELHGKRVTLTATVVEEGK